MKKIDSLQGLRALAFLSVFLFHGGVVQCCAWAVSVFFILSGFLMYYAYKDSELDCSLLSNIRFAYGKIRKLYPLHILMMMASLIYVMHDVLATHNMHKLIEICIQVGFNVTLLQSFIPAESIYFSLNGVTWFLSTILLSYMIFPYINKIIQKKYSIKKAIASSILLYLLQVIITLCVEYCYMPNGGTIEMSNWLTHISPFFRIIDFVIGCNLGYIFLNITNKNRQYKLRKCDFIIHAIIELIVFGILVLCILVYNRGWGFFGTSSARHTVLFTPIAACLVYIFAIKHGIITKLLSTRLFIWLGDISSYAYVIHMMVLSYTYTLFTKLNFEHNKWIFVPICLVCTILLTVIYIKCIDNRMRRKNTTT